MLFDSLLIRIVVVKKNNFHFGINDRSRRRGKECYTFPADYRDSGGLL